MPGLNNGTDAPYVVQFAHKDAVVRVRVFPEQGHAVVLGLFSKQRRMGQGTALMQEVVDWSDENNHDLILRVMRFGGGTARNGLDNKQLVAFYQKFGFIVTDFSDIVIMRRDHNKGESAMDTTNWDHICAMDPSRPCPNCGE